MTDVYGIVLIDSSMAMRVVRDNGELHRALQAIRPVLARLTVGHTEFPTHSLMESVGMAGSGEAFATIAKGPRVVVCASNSHCEDGTTKALIEEDLRHLPDDVCVVLLPVGDLEAWATIWFNFIQRNREQLGSRFDVIRSDQGQDIGAELERIVRPFVEGYTSA